MFYLVPLACARGEMAHADSYSGFIRQFLQLQFPQPQTCTIATARVRRDQQSVYIRIEFPSFVFPPTSY